MINDSPSLGRPINPPVGCPSMAESGRYGNRQYVGIRWKSPPDDQDGPPDCPDCGVHMLKLWLRVRQYLAETRSLVWSGFWFCSECRSTCTASWPDLMKYEADQDGFKERYRKRK